MKPFKVLVNFNVPIEIDESLSWYNALCKMGFKMNEIIEQLNKVVSETGENYGPDNPPPYPVLSVNGQTGEIKLDIPENAYTPENPPPYPVLSVNGLTGEVKLDIPENAYTPENQPPYPVLSVNGKSGAVIIEIDDIEGLENQLNEIENKVGYAVLYVTESEFGTMDLKQESEKGNKIIFVNNDNIFDNTAQKIYFNDGGTPVELTTANIIQLTFEEY